MKNDDTGSRTFDKTGCWQPPIPTHPQKLRGVPSKSTDDGTHVNRHVTRRSVACRKTTVTAREPTVKCLNRRAPNRRTPNSQSLYMIPAPVCAPDFCIPVDPVPRVQPSVHDKHRVVPFFRSMDGPTTFSFPSFFLAQAAASTKIKSSSEESLENVSSAMFPKTRSKGHHSTWTLQR